MIQAAPSRVLARSPERGRQRVRSRDRRGAGYRRVDRQQAAPGVLREGRRARETRSARQRGRARRLGRISAVGVLRIVALGGGGRAIVPRRARDDLLVVRGPVAQRGG